MQQTYSCEKCGTPFVRCRIDQRGCSPRCRRWLYEHQDQIAGLRPWTKPPSGETAEQREARTREQRRQAMSRYRARKRAGLVARQISDPIKRATYLRVAEKEIEEAHTEQRVCNICCTTFLFDPLSGLLPGCSKLCRRLLYKQQVGAMR